MDTMVLASWTIKCIKCKKISKKNTRLNSEKVTSLEKSKLTYKLCESCMIGKQHCTLSRIVN